ncbi:MAG TPA: hypothetical protein VFD13_01410 [Candidatus Kapabacteria bacterium]|nr:hypothetical protein [Candidatus Kapabacteria bacterium]
MPTYIFQETCTSRPTYKIEADSLESATQEYWSGTSELVSDEVFENFLIAVYDEEDNNLFTPEMAKNNPPKLELNKRKK